MRASAAARPSPSVEPVMRTRDMGSCRSVGQPALGLLFPGGGLTGQWRAPAGAQSVDDDRQMALPELGGAAGVAELDAGQELQQELDVQVGDIVPELAGGADA